jgi:hypothetical protein
LRGPGNPVAFLPNPQGARRGFGRLLKEIGLTVARFPLKIQLFSFQRVVFRQLDPNRRRRKKSGAGTNVLKLRRKSIGGSIDFLQKSTVSGQ